MAEEIGDVVFAGERRGIIGFSGGGHTGRRLTKTSPACKWRGGRISALAAAEDLRRGHLVRGRRAPQFAFAVR